MNLPSTRLAVTAAALMVLATGFGSAALGQSEAPLDPVGASFWTGTWTGTSMDEPVESSGDGYTDTLVTVYGVVEASDPRIEGDWTQNHLIRTFPVREATGADVSIATATVRIDKPDGAWVGTFTGYYGQPGGEEWNTLSGEGAYEGLTAVFRYHADDSLEGIIVPGDVPPLPDAVVPAASLQTIGQAADDGARIVAVDTIDARARDLTIDSPAVGTVQVRLLLPAGFDAEPGTTWPVLYLLHGYGGNHADWTELTDVEALTEPMDLLVVMPDAANGWYTDAWNGGAGGPPAWETFHTTELLQLLERNWGAGDDRVIAGLSMGGLGAMDYAARHPGLFKAAASYSGVLDTTGQELFDGEAAFGDPVAQADNWQAHNPLDLAAALEGIPLYVSYGDGQPGPLDIAGTPDAETELWVAPQNAAFVDRLQELGIPATVDAYGPGTHDWPYWERALHDSLPMLLEALGE